MARRQQIYRCARPPLQFLLYKSWQHPKEDIIKNTHHSFDFRSSPPATKFPMEKVPVFIVGAGTSGLAVAACLTHASIPYVIVDREDCSVSLWRKRTYNRLQLHLAKEFCELPHMPYPSDTPTYILKEQFLRYVDAYIEHFNICPKYRTSVESSEYDEVKNCWVIKQRDQISGLVTEYTARFLVVATGENSEGIIPEIPGIDYFHGEIIHSSSYKSWNNYEGKRVLVVGCGNSGMEIAYDLASNGVDTSIVIRSPVCICYTVSIKVDFILTVVQIQYQGVVLFNFETVTSICSCML
jgi:indole-3-pyruvate monooxygenase